MVAWHVAVRPAVSVAVNVTTCGPRPTNVPAGGFWVMTGQQQLSVAATSAVISGNAAWQFAPATMVRFVAQAVMIGGVGLASAMVMSTRPTAVPPYWPPIR